MKINKWSTMLFNEEEGANGGGTTEPSRGSSIFEPIPEPTAAAEPAPTTPVVEKPPGEVVPEPTPVPQTLDAAAFAKEFGKVIAESIPKAPEPEPAKLSPEEAEKLLNVWKATPEWIERFDNLETRAAAIKEMNEGIVKQGDTLTQVRVNQAMSVLEAKMEEKYAPAVAFMTEQAAAKREEKFNTKYPQLADAKHKKLLSAIVSGLKETNTVYQTEDELFDDIAKNAEAVFQQVDPNFKLSTGSIPIVKTKPTSKASPNAIPVSTPGSGGGGGGQGQQAVAKPRGLAIFD